MLNCEQSSLDLICFYLIICFYKFLLIFFLLVTSLLLLCFFSICMFLSFSSSSSLTVFSYLISQNLSALLIFSFLQIHLEIISSGYYCITFSTVVPLHLKCNRNWQYPRCTTVSFYFLKFKQFSRLMYCS